LGEDRFFSRIGDSLEAACAAAESGPFRQGRSATAATIERLIDLLHDGAKVSPFGQAAGDPLHRSPLSLGRVTLDEQLAMLEQILRLLIDPTAPASRPARCRRRRTPAAEFRFRGGRFLPHLGHRRSTALVNSLMT